MLNSKWEESCEKGPLLYAKIIFKKIKTLKIFSRLNDKSYHKIQNREWDFEILSFFEVQSSNWGTKFVNFWMIEVDAKVVQGFKFLMF